MSLKTTILTTLILLSTTSQILAQGEFHESVFPEFSAELLLAKLVEDYKTTSVLNYGEARDVMYGLIDSKADSVSCVYSGHRLYLPEGVDPSTFLYMNGSSNGINAEHTFPRSKGADEENGNAFSDLHHLFPVRTGVNTARSNLAFGEIEDELTTHWYFEDEIEEEMPGSKIDDYSEKTSNLFEPREDHKGNLARAMFYFYTMYQEEADEADPVFFESQKEDLCTWHFLDPVDAEEWDRTYLISSYQDNLVNPFVLDCSLATRTFCGELASCEASVMTSNKNLTLLENTTSISPNPSNGDVEISFEINEEFETEIQCFDMLGRSILSIEKQIYQAGNYRIPSFIEGNGIFVFKIIFENSKGTHIINKKVIVNSI